MIEISVFPIRCSLTHRPFRNLQRVRLRDGFKIAPARITVFHMIQIGIELVGKQRGTVIFKIVQTRLIQKKTLIVFSEILACITRYVKLDSTG